MTNTFTVSEVRTKDAFQSLRGEWNELIEKDHQATVFQTWEFQFHTWQIFEDDISPCLVLVRNEAGQLIGCAPLGSRTWGRGLVSVRILEFCSEKFSDYCDFIINSDYSSDVLAELAAWFHQHAPQWDVIRLGSLLETAWAKNDEDFLSRFLLPLRSRQVSIAPYIHFEQDWSSYEDAVSSKKRRTSLRYSVRNLFRNFDGRYEEPSSGHAVSDALEQLMNLHQKRMQEKSQKGHFASPRARNQFHLLIKELEERGIAKIHSIRSDEMAIASICTFEYRGSVSYYLGGIEPEFKRLSPGMVIQCLRINDALNSGAVEYDFLDGDEPYKAVWANKRKSIFEIEIVTSSWRRVVYHLWDKLRQCIAQSDRLRAIYLRLSTMMGR
jgi:CelD/BcsL family acetyltransferase involved in cellulose biosynthesis